MNDIYFYAYQSHGDAKNRTAHLRETILDPCSMTGDYLLFDTPEKCIAYYREEGIEVITDEG